jgi:hypothetical protein
MSASKLGERCQLLKEEIEQVITMVNFNSAALQFSIDDTYEVEYLVDSLEKNARRLKSFLKSSIKQLDDENCPVCDLEILGETSSSANDCDWSPVKSDVGYELRGEQQTSAADDMATKQLETSNCDLTDIGSPSAIQRVCNNLTVKDCSVQLS